MNNIIKSITKVLLCISTPCFLSQGFPNYNSSDIALIFGVGGCVGLLLSVIDRLFGVEGGEIKCIKIVENVEYWDREWEGFMSGKYKPCKHPWKIKKIGSKDGVRYQEDHECDIPLKAFKKRGNKTNETRTHKHY